MADLNDTVRTYDAVYEIASGDDVQGGTGGIDNMPHQSLVNRTNYLKFLADRGKEVVMSATIAANAANVNTHIRITSANVALGHTFTMPAWSDCPVGTFMVFSNEGGVAVQILANGGNFMLYNDSLPSSGIVSSLYCMADTIIMLKEKDQTTWSVIQHSETEVGQICIRPTGANNWGWRQCDGSSENTGVLPRLFARIAYTFGGSGSLFNMPSIASPGSGLFYFIKY